jgi:NAD(P)-dependent dehydrogenase (short-subunit alcohol dehydrogenase family)
MTNAVRGKVVIVTGAGGGIEREIALAMGSEANYRDGTLVIIRNRKSLNHKESAGKLLARNECMKACKAVDVG